MDRYYWAKHIARLDPVTEYEQIYRIIVTHEFPWDMTQALELGAVPDLRRAEHRGAARGHRRVHRAQKRYADTGLILEAVLEHGFASPRARRDPPHEPDARRVRTPTTTCATCVDVRRDSIRWIDRFGWRPLSESERRRARTTTASSAGT